VHEVALVVLQLSVAVPPVNTATGLAVRLTVGAGAVTLTVAVAVAGVVPLAPEHVSV
jgi:hypothetical protein